jgi:hypothetical protein
VYVNVKNIRQEFSGKTYMEKETDEKKEKRIVNMHVKLRRTLPLSGRRNRLSFGISKLTF